MTPEKTEETDLRPIADIDRAVHAPARLMILAFLSAVERADFTFLLNQTGLTRGNLSSHLQKLEGVDYISVQKEFVVAISRRVPRTLISLTDEGREAVQLYRETMRQVVDELLS